MKKIILFCFICITFFGCSTSKKAITNNENKSAYNSVRDGSSFETAIVINETRETPGIAKEYQWLRENYPGYTSKGQSLNHAKVKSYDIISIKTANGAEKNIYFDISKFFGKF